MAEKIERNWKNMDIILTGDRPTGRLHLGHYVGSLKRRVEMQNSGKYDKIYIMIADAQALTDNADNIDKVRNNIAEVALDYMACGIDPKKATIFIQSQIPELFELTAYYMNLVTVSRVQRNPTVKNEIQMRGFKQSIPVGFLPIRLVRRLILPLLRLILCRWAKINCRCLSKHAKLCARLTLYTKKFWWNRKQCCLIMPFVRAYRGLTALPR